MWLCTKAIQYCKATYLSSISHLLTCNIYCFHFCSVHLQIFRFNTEFLFVNQTDPHHSTIKITWSTYCNATGTPSCSSFVIILSNESAATKNGVCNIQWHVHFALPASTSRHLLGVKRDTSEPAYKPVMENEQQHNRYQASSIWILCQILCDFQYLTTGSGHHGNGMDLLIASDIITITPSHHIKQAEQMQKQSVSSMVVYYLLWRSFRTHCLHVTLLSTTETDTFLQTHIGKWTVL